MHQHKSIWIRIVAYVSVIATASLMIASILVAIFGDGVVERVAAIFLALACLGAGRYISAQVWGKRAPAK
jgi:hypothetical protein